MTRVVVLIVPVNAVAADGATNTPVRMTFADVGLIVMFAFGNERCPAPSDVPVIDPVNEIEAGVPGGEPPSVILSVTSKLIVV
jgi:hypothetical protein